jgi:hypothetical protein
VVLRNELERDRRARAEYRDRNDAGASTFADRDLRLAKGEGSLRAWQELAILRMHRQSADDPCDGAVAWPQSEIADLRRGQLWEAEAFAVVGLRAARLAHLVRLEEVVQPAE